MPVTEIKLTTWLTKIEEKFCQKKKKKKKKKENTDLQATIFIAYGCTSNLGHITNRHDLALSSPPKAD